MRIRQMIVRAVNKWRGVDAEKMHKLRLGAQVPVASVALYMNVPHYVVLDWENEYAAMLKPQYESVMAYLRSRKRAWDMERAERDWKEFAESPVWQD